MPTASAVVADLIDVATGRAALLERSRGLWSSDAPAPHLAAPEHVRSRYYLRFLIADQPGVLGTIAQVLGRHDISIASVIQHEISDDAPPDTPVPLVIMTHQAVDARLAAALAEIDRLAIVAPPSVCLGVEEA